MRRHSRRDIRFFIQRTAAVPFRCDSEVLCGSEEADCRRRHTLRMGCGEGKGVAGHVRPRNDRVAHCAEALCARICGSALSRRSFRPSVSPSCDALLRLYLCGCVADAVPNGVAAAVRQRSGGEVSPAAACVCRESAVCQDRLSASDVGRNLRPVATRWPPSWSLVTEWTDRRRW